MPKIYAILLCVVSMINPSHAQEIFPLYQNKIPNSKDTKNAEETGQENGITVVRKISVPTIRHFPAPTQVISRTAVIIFPGGGYSTNSLSHEGHDIAKKFNEIGVSAFVVKYRLPDDETMIDKKIGPLQDAQQAIKIVREQADKFSIDPKRIGVVGFSAGGHLASTAGTHFKDVQIPNENKTSIRPDFMILIYPVVSFDDDIGHRGSRDRLLGTTPEKSDIDLYSNELQVTAETPPSFLAHASDDEVVVPANSIRFYENLLRHKVPAELHIYQEGGHGFGLNNPKTRDEWFLSCKHWMETNGWLKRNK
jgi:acetyl esterase/lipase